MIKRSTWIVLLIFFILVGVVIILQKSPEILVTPTPTPTPYPKMLAGWVDKTINRIEILNLSKESITLKTNTNNQWEFSSLDNSEVDQGKVEELLSTLKSASIISTVDPNTDLNIVGLENPNLSIALQSTDGETAIIKIGSNTPTGSGAYVQVDDSPPVVIRSVTLESILPLADKVGLISPPLPTEATPAP